MIELSLSLDKDLMTAASAFAQKVMPPLQLIKTAIDVFTSVAEFQVSTGVFDKLDTLISHIWNVLRKIGNLRDAFTQDVLDDATSVSYTHLTLPQSDLV